MSFVLKDRIKEGCSVSGTGDIGLLGAATGFQPFSVIGNSNSTYYGIVHDSEWEVGYGTYNSSTNSLSRDYVIESSNSGSLVDFSAGDKTVFCTYPASKAVTLDGYNKINWDLAYGWGNHASAGYLTSETEPVYTSSSWYSTINNAGNWDAAYGWGNHASAGYLTSSSIGVSVQAYDADLTTWAGKTAPAGTVVGTSDAQTLGSKTLEHPIITGTIKEDVYDITDNAGFAIDPTNGSIQRITLTASRTPTVANFDAGESVTLMVNDNTSSYMLTWTTIGVVWVGSSAPSLSPSGGYTVIELWKVGTTIYGALVGQVA